MKKFAKLYETEEFGQVLVDLGRDESGNPSMQFRVMSFNNNDPFDDTAMMFVFETEAQALEKFDSLSKASLIERVSCYQDYMGV